MFEVLVDANVLLDVLTEDRTCFRKYRRAGGTRRSPLPDFYIGAHAAVRRMPLLTRYRGRYRSYFPGLELVLPRWRRR